MVTKGYGFTVDDIDWSSPADLKPYEKAHKLEMTEQDNLMYMWFGSYALSAVSVAVEHNLAGVESTSRKTWRNTGRNALNFTRSSLKNRINLCQRKNYRNNVNYSWQGYRLCRVILN